MISGARAIEEDLIGRLKILSERLWEGRCRGPDIDEWLANFEGRVFDQETERLYALHLLSSMSYFGLRELRILLRAMFRDLFRYPLVQELRRTQNDTNDFALINQLFDQELSATRFVGMGNPAESGTHLLYYFRQENRITKDLFVHEHQLLSTAATDPMADIADPTIKRVVFIDDLCGSGRQSVEYSETILRDLATIAKRHRRTLETQYLVLFGTSDGLAHARSHSTFNKVAAVSELDGTYRTFGAESRVFRKPPAGLLQTDSEALAREYGADLWSDWPLGYNDDQLLLAFHHNVPDNTLPIVWFDESPWRPVFPRFPKV